MKCFKHSPTDAVAVCVYCGRGLCRDCVPIVPAARIVCSPDCGSALARDAKALGQLLRQSSQNARASAFYCYLCGGLSAAAAVVAWFMLPSPFLILFTGGCAVVLIVSGIWYGRGAKKQNLD